MCPAQLVMPMPIMIWLAVIVEAAIANWLDMIILLLIQFINASIGWFALNPQHIEKRIHNGGCCHSAGRALASQLLAPFLELLAPLHVNDMQHQQGDTS